MQELIAMIAQTASSSQKRDNQRAERNAISEAYHSHASAQMVEIASLLTDMGFIMVDHEEIKGTPITIWDSERAVIKQTPFNIHIYNTPITARRKRGEANLVNRMEHGWCARGEATGYAAGIVAALLPLLETPDPYMQALDAMEQRYPAGDYRNDYPEDDNLLPPVRDCQRCGRQLTISGICQWCDMEQGEHPPTPEMTAWGNAPWYSASLAKTYPAISGGSQEADTEQAVVTAAYPEKAFHGRMVTVQRPASLWQRYIIADGLGVNRSRFLPGELACITTETYGPVDTGYEITTHEQIAARRKQAFIDTEKAYQEMLKAR